MRVHSLDALILLVVMVGVVTVSILEFGPQDSSAKKDPVSCWSPAHFTRSMVDYTNSYCAGALKRGVVYKFIEDILPGFESEKFTKNDSMIATEEVLRTDQKLSKLLLAETLVALLTFVVQYMVLAFLISKVQGETEDQGYSTDNAEKSATGASQNSGIRGSKALSKSSWVTVIYCLVLLAAAIAWFVMGGISHGAALAKPDPGSTSWEHNALYGPVHGEPNGFLQIQLWTTYQHFDVLHHCGTFSNSPIVYIICISTGKQEGKW